jgi:DNA-binding transcriptional LysR family regulator
MDRTEHIGRRLKLRDLQLLNAIARSGSIAKAAGQLNLTQPAASKAITQLERAIGVRLLDRSTRGVEPTIYGRALLKHGLVMFDELRQGVEEIEFLADPTAGEVRVGCPEAIAAGLLPAVIEQLGRQYPRIVCDVTWMPPTTRLRFHELRERTVDLVLVRMLESDADDDLHTEVLFHDPMRVVAGKRNKWLRRPRVELSELIDERWILTPRDSFAFSLVAEAFHGKGLDVPRANVVSASIHIVNRLLPTGRYLTIIPESVLRFGAMRAEIKALPVDFPTGRGPFAAVSLKNRTLTPAASLFIEAARLVTRPLANAK